jgi:hypothetical protein
MRRFVAGGLRSLGNQIKVPIRPDKDGYIGRECPERKCREYFKITLGTGIKHPALCHCPYCGHTGDADTFATRIFQSVEAIAKAQQQGSPEQG